MLCVDHSIDSVLAAESVARSGLLDRKNVCLLHVCSSLEPSDCDSDLLSSVEHRLRHLCVPSKIDRFFSFGSNAADCILDKAALLEPSLIVVGARKRSGFERVMLGSVSQRLIARSKVPVLLSRENLSTGSGRVLLAVDDSAASAGCLQWIAGEPWSINKEIVLLSVLESMSSAFYSGSDIAKAAEELSKHDWKESSRLKLMASWSALLAGFLGRDFVGSTISDGRAAETILKASAHWGAEIVVVGAAAKIRSERLLLGSVSQAIAEKALGSVLVVPESGMNDFEKLRIEIHKSDDLAVLLSEKPHPAKTHSPITGTDTNGFMAYW